MAQQVALERAPETVLTFRPFIEYLRKRRDETNCHKSRFFSFVIEQFEKHPELLQPIEVEKVKDLFGITAIDLQHAFTDRRR